MAKLLESNSLNIPEPAALEGCEYEPLLYFLLSDRAFPLKGYMVIPFPGQLADDEKVFNYRQSRGRRVIENTFGILRTRWRILGKPGKGKSAVDKNIGCLRELTNVRGSRSRQGLLDIRNGIKNYFKTEKGQVD